MENPIMSMMDLSLDILTNINYYYPKLLSEQILEAMTRQNY